MLLLLLLVVTITWCTVVMYSDQRGIKERLCLVSVEWTKKRSFGITKYFVPIVDETNQPIHPCWNQTLSPMDRPARTKSISIDLSFTTKQNHLFRCTPGLSSSIQFYLFHFIQHRERKMQIVAKQGGLFGKKTAKKAATTSTKVTVKKSRGSSGTFLIYSIE